MASKSFVVVAWSSMFFVFNNFVWFHAAAGIKVSVAAIYRYLNKAFQCLHTKYNAVKITQ